MIGLRLIKEALVMGNSERRPSPATLSADLLAQRVARDQIGGLLYCNALPLLTYPMLTYPVVPWDPAFRVLMNEAVCELALHGARTTLAPGAR